MASFGLIHISDLHLGFGGSSIPGAQNHEARVLWDLLITLAEIRETKTFPYYLVISGDATSSGAVNEFEYYTMLRDRGLMWDNGRQFEALRSGMSGLLDIPGNHDYWNGQLVNPNINPSARSYFSPPPWILNVQLGGFSINFHGICSAFGAAGPNQRWAVGQFDRNEFSGLTSQIAAADAAGKQRGFTPIDFIITHHSPRFCDGAGNTDLDPASHQDLVNLCAANANIKGLLTGHVHAYRIGNRSGDGLEARCSTTTQMHTFLNHPHRGFLQHEFSETKQGRLNWTITPWEDTRSAFKPIHKCRESYLL